MRLAQGRSLEESRLSLLGALLKTLTFVLAANKPAMAAQILENP